MIQLLMKFLILGGVIFGIAYALNRMIQDAKAKKRDAALQIQLQAKAEVEALMSALRRQEITRAEYEARAEEIYARYGCSWRLPAPR